MRKLAGIACLLTFAGIILVPLVVSAGFLGAAMIVGGSLGMVALFALGLYLLED